MPARNISFQDNSDLLQWIQVWTRRGLILADVIAHLLHGTFGKILNLASVLGLNLAG